MKNKSLKKTLKITYIVLLSITLIPSVYSIVVSQIHTQQYNKIISNVSNANRINGIVKDDIPEELWNIICGKKDVEEGRHYEMMNEITFGLEEMLKITKSNDSRDKLEVATRASATLLRSIHNLIARMSFGSSVSENEALLEEIRTITGLFSDIMQDFIVSESESAYRTNLSIKNTSIILTLILLVITIFALLISANSFMTVSAAIQKPISDMEKLSTKVANGELDARIDIPHVDELDTLAENLNPAP